MPMREGHASRLLTSEFSVQVEQKTSKRVRPSMKIYKPPSYFAVNPWALRTPSSQENLRRIANCVYAAAVVTFPRALSVGSGPNPTSEKKTAGEGVEGDARKDCGAHRPPFPPPLYTLASLKKPLARVSGEGEGGDRAGFSWTDSLSIVSPPRCHAKTDPRQVYRSRSGVLYYTLFGR